MLRKLLFLKRGDLSRLAPFFILYFFLFSALSLADGLSLALFVPTVGAAHLPTAYGSIALANVAVMAAYVLLADRLGSVRLFAAILGAAAAILTAVWLMLQLAPGWTVWYVVLFAAREIGATLVLMHFGTVLQDFFSREELDRVLTVIYAGGRLGGIAGGALLEHLANIVGLMHLLAVVVALLLVGGAILALIHRRVPRSDHAAEALGDPGLAPPRAGNARDVEAGARSSFAGFLHFVWASPLLFWITITSLLFMLCRWILNFEYSAFFGGYFDDEIALAQFLGLYTQIALAVSLVIQLLVVNRMVAWLGLRGTHLIYSALVFAAVAVSFLGMTFATAVFARIIENELRYGLRNPLTQLLTNKFPRTLRPRVRAWSFGVVTPLATLLSSIVLGGLVRGGAAGWVTEVGALCGLAYLASCFGLYRSFSERSRSRDASGQAEAVLSGDSESTPG